MGYPRFPSEIFIEIISLIPPSDYATLRACQLTSRAFKEFSNGVLYERLTITWAPLCGIPLLATIDRNPSLAHLVKSVTVKFPRFDEAGNVSRRFEEIRERLWEAEERRWPAKLLQVDPGKHEDFERRWTDEFLDYLDSTIVLHWDLADREAWAELRKTGNTDWLDNGPRGDDARWEGGDLLAVLLASLPNLRGLDFATYDCGIPTLPQLTFLALENDKAKVTASLPDTANIEELVLSGHFCLPSESAIPPRFPNLHTLRVLRLLSSHTTALVAEILEIIRDSIKTLNIRVINDEVDARTIAESLAPILITIRGLETLSLARDDISPIKGGSIVQASPFLTYLAQSSVRDLSLPFLPSPHLFASLPATIKRIKLPEKVSGIGIIRALKSILLEKGRLHHLVFVEMTRAAGLEMEDAIVMERVEQGRLLGVEIVLRCFVVISD
ncbi:hypothetical protein RQP46_001666 [Phenoliferia psychrophenolica]